MRWGDEHDVLGLCEAYTGQVREEGSRLNILCLMSVGDQETTTSLWDS